MDRDSVYKLIRDNPHDETLHKILADWFDEQGEELHALQMRIGQAPYEFRSQYKDQYGDGYGYGYGYGNGYGSGDEDRYGDGDGYGDGYVGRNVNSSRINYFNSELKMPEFGNQLIILPHGWVICGNVVKQIGPYQFIVENTSLICRTGGVPWDELANGNRRHLAIFRYWGTVTIGPQFIMSREWKGDLPKIS